MRRVQTLDWGTVAASLDAEGCAVLEGLLSPAECGELAAGVIFPDAL